MENGELKKAERCRSCDFARATEFYGVTGKRLLKGKRGWCRSCYERAVREGPISDTARRVASQPFPDDCIIDKF